MSPVQVPMVNDFPKDAPWLHSAEADCKAVAELGAGGGGNGGWTRWEACSLPSLTRPGPRFHAVASFSRVFFHLFLPNMSRTRANVG